jgi:hypothetical protein
MSDRVHAALGALVRKRSALSDAQFLAYWRDVHATLAAGVPDSQLYRIHLIRPASPLLLRAPDGVATTAPEAERVDGIAELRWTSQAALERWGAQPLLTEHVSADEQNVFGHCAVYWALGDGVVEAKDEIPGIVVDGDQGLPTLILLVREVAGGRDALREYLRAVLGPALAAQPGVARLTLHLLEPYVPIWSSPNVKHEETAAYGAWAEITLRRLDDVGLVLAAPAVEAALADAAGVAEALHVYREEQSYTLRYDGRPTLAGRRGYPIAATMLEVGSLNQLSRDLTAIAKES